MAQAPDTIGFGDAPVPVEAALERLRALVRPVSGTETVPLAEADGRVLAADMAAPFPLPPFFNAAMDGYALRFADLTPGAETALPVAARLAAGHSAEGVSLAGAAARIFTGAPMPAGADTVAMQEQVLRQGDTVIVPSGLARGANCRPAGEDVAAGAVLLKAGRRLTPEAVALAAALGLDRLAVRRRLRVAVLSSGEELAAPGTARLPHQVYDANRFSLMALCRRAGCAVTDLGRVRDDPAAVREALRAAAPGHDAILTSGGVSVGEEDHMKAAVSALGRLTLWQLAVKPGRPLAVGLIPGGGKETLFIGLPGNPVAVFVIFATIARPLLTALAGADYATPLAMPVRAAFACTKKPSVREFVRASLVRAADGMVEAHRHPRQGAGAVHALAETDGFVVLPEEVTRVEPGDTVAYLDYARLHACG